jgi:DtxR family transcriptional regulator, Mn-dependent transcriptional regulator
MEVGESGILARVSDSDDAMLRYLAERDIHLGVRLRVEDKQPFDGPLEVTIAGRSHVLGGTLARAMRVSLTANSQHARR